MINFLKNFTAAVVIFFALLFIAGQVITAVVHHRLYRVVKGGSTMLGPVPEVISLEPTLKPGILNRLCMELPHGWNLERQGDAYVLVGDGRTLYLNGALFAGPIRVTPYGGVGSYPSTKPPRRCLVFPEPPHPDIEYTTLSLFTSGPITVREMSWEISK